MRRSSASCDFNSHGGVTLTRGDKRGDERAPLAPLIAERGLSPAVGGVKLAATSSRELTPR